jgi:hypothetical protein
VSWFTALLGNLRTQSKGSDPAARL